MKRNILILTALLFSFYLKAQSLHLIIEGKNAIENKTIDSIGYVKKHPDAKSVETEAQLFLTTIQKQGYLESAITNSRKVNDSTFLFNFLLGNRTKALHIYTGNIATQVKTILNIDKDTIVLPVPEIESFMSGSVGRLEMHGYSLSDIKLSGYTKRGSALYATLFINTEKKRTLDGLVIEGYEKFPEGLRRNIIRQYRGKTFNRDNLERLYNEFNALRFVNQVRYPEILFTTDSTKVYAYLEKSKANTFDGFIGFGNEEGGKIIFTGYLDLALNNVLNSGEKFNLYWKSDGNKQTTFNASAELPYIFRSSIGIKGLLRIFKQDTTFQNTVTDINIGYYFNYNSKLYLGHQKTQSVDIQNTNSTFISDYSNTFWTTSYEYTRFTIDDFLFPERTSLFIKAGFGQRSTSEADTDQYFLQLNASHNIYLNKKNIINLRTQTYYLNSDTYIINELFRFGGINSVRGFNENSLQANFIATILAEYRYILAPGMYVHSVTDYARFQDMASNVNENLLGLGFGFGILTKNGRFNLTYANGSTQNQQIKLSNSIAHISFKAIF